MKLLSGVNIIFLFMFVSFGNLESVSAQINVEAEQKVLLATDVEFAQTSLRKGPSAAFYQYLADDAMQLPEGSMPIYGKNAIYETMKGDHYDLLWTPVKAEVAKSGELGWTWGNYIVIVKNEDGTKTKMHGKYLNIWRKQKDGKWKLIVDMGNSSPAPK